MSHYVCAPEEGEPCLCSGLEDECGCRALVVPGRETYCVDCHVTCVRACVGCGCTELEACEGGCWWSATNEDLCTSCAP